MVIKRSIGFPARALRSPVTAKILELERKNTDYEALKLYISGEVNRRWIYDGIQEEGFGWAGQAVGLIHDIPEVSELIQRMVIEAEEIRRKWTAGDSPDE
ncbi:Nitronate monooxygenase [compost metagenome]